MPSSDPIIRGDSLYTIVDGPTWEEAEANAQALGGNLVAINERGLVGKIISASKNNSKILLLNDQNLSVPIKSYKEDFFAIIKGTTNGNFLIISFIKGEIKPKVGEMILTSGNGKTFPSNILVGKIIKVEKNRFFVLPYVDFDNLNYIQIIDNN